ncbi:MAG: 50S ribosomal protein L33 [Clostridia bacterium]|nr:50S ribosomal protein L33 [Clostridia bacterium]
MAKKKNQINEHITLACEECNERNYATTKNKRNNPDRMILMKFCKKCNKRTKHKETK